MNILVSACLMGDPVRYDGSGKSTGWIRQLGSRHVLYKICPEVAGGLPVPREPSEIRGDSRRILELAGLARLPEDGSRAQASDRVLARDPLTADLRKVAASQGVSMKDGRKEAVPPGVYTKAGGDVTEPFLQGALATLDLCREHGIAVAILKERSPSCGTGAVYDGTHTGRVIPGPGITAALLTFHGIRVFSEEDGDEALRFLACEAGGPGGR